MGRLSETQRAARVLLGASGRKIPVTGSVLAGRAAVAGVTLLLSVLAASGVARGAQDSMAAARELYAGAAYRDAIGMLDRLAAGAATIASAGEDELSPRTRRLFEDARRRALPAVVQERYERAKAVYQSGRPQEALALFDGVIALLDAVGSDGTTSSLVADLRVLASGFRDLASAAVQAEAGDATSAVPVTGPISPPRFASRAPGQPADSPAASPAAAAAAAAPPQPPATPPPVIVTPPETLQQDVPPWPRDVPFPDPAVAIIEVVIGAGGRVLEARLQRPVHPRYDELLLAAARNWTYRPAVREGQPTPFVKAVRIELSRDR